MTAPSDLARSVRRRVGPRGLSGFVARALQREQLGAYLEELDNELGPVPDAALTQARRASRGR